MGCKVSSAAMKGATSATHNPTSDDARASVSEYASIAAINTERVVTQGELDTSAQVKTRGNRRSAGMAAVTGEPMVTLGWIDSVVQYSDVGGRVASLTVFVERLLYYIATHGNCIHR